MAEELVAGLATGASYSLLALALVLVLKATDVPNFAMAEMGLVPAFIAWSLLRVHVPYFPALVVMIGVALAMGWFLELTVGRRLLGRPHAVTVVVTIALWYLLKSITALVWGSDTRSVAAPYSSSFRVGSAVITEEQVAVLAAVLLVAAALTVVFRTQFGLYLRAIAMDGNVPRLLGVSVGRLSSVTWALATAIASLAILFDAQTTALSSSTGDGLLIGAFVAATLGGFTSVTGAVTGGLVLGVLQAVAGHLVSPAAESAVALVVVLVVLLARPSGLLGEAETRQV